MPIIPDNLQQLFSGNFGRPGGVNTSPADPEIPSDYDPLFE
jgi:hypothetical protein